MIGRLSECNLIYKLDKDKIPNLKNVRKEFVSPSYDKDNTFSVPYLWGTIGLLVNTKYVKDEIDSWNDLLSPDYRGKIEVINDYREVVGAAQKSLNISFNSKKKKIFKKCQSKFKDSKKMKFQYGKTIIMQRDFQMVRLG